MVEQCGACTSLIECLCNKVAVTGICELIHQASEPSPKSSAGMAWKKTRTSGKSTSFQVRPKVQRGQKKWADLRVLHLVVSHPCKLLTKWHRHGIIWHFYSVPKYCNHCFTIMVCPHQRLMRKMMKRNNATPPLLTDPSQGC